MERKIIGIQAPEINHLHDFIKSSTLFKYAWEGIGNVIQRGEQSNGTTVKDHTLAVVDTYLRILRGDYSSFLARTGVAPLTFHRMAEIANRIHETPSMDQLFTLVLYSHDFGKLHRNGPGHKEAGALNITSIIRGLDLDQYSPDEREKWLLFGQLLVRHHSLPSEIYLGEASLKTYQTAIGMIREEDRPLFMQMLSLLNICDVNGVKGGRSLFESNAQYILDLSDMDMLYIKEFGQIDERIWNLSRAEFPKKGYEDYSIADRERYAQLHEMLNDLEETDRNNIVKLLSKVDFHYTASVFIKLKPEAILNFLLETIKAIGEKDITDIYISNDKKGDELSKHLKTLGRATPRRKKQPSIIITTTHNPKGITWDTDRL